MKKSLVALGSLLSFVVAGAPTAQLSAFVPTLGWTVSVKSSSTNPSYARSVAVDASGNSYVVGAFYGSVDFDPSPGNTTLAPDETLGAFMAKYNPSGALEWAFDLGYGNSSAFYDVKVDQSGDVWVVGSLAGKMNPAITQVNINPLGGAGNEVFLTGLSTSGSHSVVLRYNSSGILQSYFKPLEGGSSRVWSFDFGPSNTLFVSGAYRGDQDFDPDPNATLTVTGFNHDNAFLAAYSTSGTYLAHVVVGDNYEDSFRAVRYSQGKVIVAGTFVSVSNPMSISGSSVNVGHGFGGAGVLASYAWSNTSFGNDWAFPIGSNNSYDRINSIDINSSGTIFVGGTIAGTKNFKGTSATNQNRTAVSQYVYAGYVASYNLSGEYASAHVYSNSVGASSVIATFAAVKIGPDGALYVSSAIEGTANFAIDGTTEEYSTASNVTQVFLARYNASLTLTGVSLLSASTFDVMDIAVLPDNVTLRTSHEFGGSPNTTDRPLLSTFGPDTTAPNAPPAPDLIAASDLGVLNTDNITSSRTPNISVTAREAGGTVRVSAESGGTTLQCSMSGSTSGSACTLPSLADGVWTVTATHQDQSGNTSTTSPALLVTIDGTAPTLSGVSPSNSATGVGLTSDVVLSFSESIAKRSGSLLVLKGNTCATTVETLAHSSSAVSVAGSTATVNPTADFEHGTAYCMTYPSGFFQDIAGNHAVAMTTSSSGRVLFTTVLDTTAPAATITSPSSPANSRTLVYAVVFDETISGLSSSDFSNVGTASCTFAVPTSSGTSFSVTATCTTDGTVVMRLAPNSVTDTAVNTGPASAVTSATVTINTGSGITPTLPPVSPTTVAPAAATATTLPQVGQGPTTQASPTTAPAVPAGGGGVTAATTVPTTTTTTTPPTTTTVPLPVVDIPNVSDDSGALVIDGKRIEATITRENNQLVIAAGVLRARISAVQREGGRAPLDSQGRIRIDQGDSIEIEVTGFAASSPVEVRMYSDPVLLGRSNVSALGSLMASYEVPESVDDGRHTVVLLGESQQGEELTFALAVFIGAESAGPSTLALLVGIPLGIAVIAALVIPAIIRRRRKDEEEK